MCEVSIIIPVYNTEKYLRKAIESCLNQTFKNLEIIIINDGSTDNSLQIAREYESKYNCVRVITTENRGLSEARNRGLVEARGKYIYFLDADDWIDSEAIEQCYKLAVDNELEMVLFDSRTELEKSLDSENSKNIKYNNYIRSHIINPDNIYTGSQFVEDYYKKGVVFVPAWLVFTKREFLLKNKIRFLPNAYYEDVAFHFSCMLMAERIMYLPQALHVRLYRAGSIMTSSLNVRKICSVYEITKEMYASLMASDKQSNYLWIDYLLYLMFSLYKTILAYVSRSDIENAISHKEEILRHQRDVIDIFYRLMALMGNKLSGARRTLEYINEIINPLGWISDEIINIADEIFSEREILVNDIFRNLPFDKESITVGIYGSGKHAEFLLNKYKEMFGEIKSNLVFIDTYKESFSDKFKGYDIINVNDVHKTDISVIVIMSYFYEEEMYNNIVSKYGNKYKIHRIYNGDKEPLDSTTYLVCYNRLKKYYEQGRKRLVLINTPLHTNIGDHIITYAVMNFFKDLLPEFDVTEVSNKLYKEKRKDVVYRTNVNDIIVVTGGGFLGSLWPYSGQNVYNILEDFPDNKIIILPQSLYFEDNEEGERQKRLFYDLAVNHKDLTVLLRENISYNRFNAMFDGKVKSYLMPDMALTLDYSHDQTERAGVLLCLRNDKESILSEEDKSAVKNHFLSLGEEVKESSMHWHTDIMQNQREEIIKTKINELKKYKLVITDALHCMISCAISGTPCIALNNVNGKLEGIYNSWLKDLNYLKYVDSVKGILHMELNDWEELNKENNYDKDFSPYLAQIADLIRK